MKFKLFLQLLIMLLFINRLFCVNVPHWWDEWKLVIKTSEIKNEIKQSVFSVTPENFKNNQSSIFLLLRNINGNYCGFIIINDNKITKYTNDSFLSSQSMWDNKYGLPVNNLKNIVQYDIARKKAANFVTSFIPDIKDTSKITGDNKPDRYGCYTFTLLTDIDKQYKGITVKIDNDGYVVEFERIGLDDIRSISSGYSEKKPVLVSESPVWSYKSQKLWWSSNSRWKNLPLWLPESPYSIAFKEGFGTDILMYRPLVDFYPVNTAYKLPSPSPDAMWMAAVIAPDIPVVISSQLNRLDCMPVNHTITSRMSWSADSTTLAFVDSAQSKAYRIKVLGEKSPFPFDTKEVPLFYDGQCSAIEYMPGTNDKLIAVYRDWVKRDDPKVWKIIEFTLIDDFPVMTRILAENLEAPLKMHVMPDGKSVMLSYPSGCWTLDYNTMKINKVDWIIDGAKIGDNAVINMKTFDWSVNDDMKIIAFCADSITEPGRSDIYVANITGTNAKIFTPNKMEDTMMRYAPKGMAVVPKSSISARLAERMRYIPEIEWGDDEKEDVGKDGK